MAIRDTETKRDERLERLTDWVRGFAGLEDAMPVPASGDASFRRYFRVVGEGSFIVMDAPPEQEDCRPFIDVAGYLEAMGLNSPRVIESDLAQGFLLLSDLGSVQYLQSIASESHRGDAAELYHCALDALITLQQEGGAFQSRLPPYDETLLRFELSLFRDWLCEKHLGIRFTDSEDEAWETVCDVLVSNALEQHTVFVHRDYHSRNLMVTERDCPGILDFQDAVEGPYTYDLVSLLKDCYVKWPPATIEEYADYYFDQQAFEPNRQRFTRHFDLMGVQRHLKAAGIFARLLHRDGKTGYLDDVPRTLGYIVDIAPRYAELGALARLITGKVLPALEQRS